MPSNIIAVVYGGLATAVAYNFPVETKYIAFCVAYSLYILFMNAVRFHNNRFAIERGVVGITRNCYGTKGYSAFIVIHALATVVAPLVVIVVAPKDIAEAMAPHLFVLMAQCGMEFLAFKTWFHPLPRLLIPWGFTAYREQMLADWVMAAPEQYQATSDDDWAKGGVVLSIVNVVLFTSTLFSFFDYASDSEVLGYE